MVRTQEDFFIKIFTSHFICKGTKGYSKFACERELETEHNWNILTPKLWPSALCLSRSPGLLNRGLESTLLGAGFPYYNSSLSDSNSTRLSTGSSNSTLLYCPLLFNSSALYYLQTPTRWYGHASTPPQFLPISGDRDVSLPLIFGMACVIVIERK